MVKQKKPDFEVRISEIAFDDFLKILKESKRLPRYYIHHFGNKILIQTLPYYSSIYALFPFSLSLHIESNQKHNSKIIGNFCKDVFRPTLFAILTVFYIFSDLVVLIQLIEKSLDVLILTTLYLLLISFMMPHILKEYKNFRNTEKEKVLKWIQFVFSHNNPVYVHYIR